MSTRASADAGSFKNRNALIWFHVPQPSCRSQAGKTSAHYCEINLVG
jgi:hypothetical protein